MSDEGTKDRSNSIAAIEKLVRAGKTVLSAEKGSVIETILRAVEEGLTATFYVTIDQYNEVMRKHWTPERVQATGLKAVSADEIKRIKKDLGVDGSGYSNSFNCPRCEHPYGMYEFLAQGIKEHGKSAVAAITELKDIGVVRVNPIQIPVCPNCGQGIIAYAAAGDGHNYICGGYGCCMVNPIRPKKKYKLRH